MRGPGGVVILSSLLLALVLPPARAAGQEVVPAGTQAMNLLRVITHDRNFTRRFDDEITVAVLYLPGNGASEQLAKLMRAAIAEHGAEAIPGRWVRTLQVGFQDEDSLSGAVHGNHIDVLYVCPELESALGAITGVTRKRNVITVGATRALVVGGLSFGIVDSGGKAKVLVNVDASREEGTKLNAQLLRVAEVVR